VKRVITERLATKEDLANLRADLEKSLREQLRWIIVLHVPTWVGIVGMLVAIIGLLLRK
jgi:hypothetical protein